VPLERWQAAVIVFDASWHTWRAAAASPIPNTVSAMTGTAQQIGQQCADALQLCRALAAAAPLPLVCNNPACQKLAGVSEAAAASKVCSGCRCRYCCVECQQADWQRHKHACRRMATAAETCV
jgi:hypothetical protein